MPKESTTIGCLRSTIIILILGTSLVVVGYFIGISLSSILTMDQEDKRILQIPAKHWEFKVLRGEDYDVDTVECYIHTKLLTDGSSNSSSESEVMDEEEYDFQNIINTTEQYVIHIHGFHHTGTGYLRQTLYDALTDEFGNNNNSSQRVASIQDALRPYYQILKEEAKVNRTNMLRLRKQYIVAENEGQHLQNVYPQFYNRMGVKSIKYNPLKAAYMADVCKIVNDDKNNDENDPDNALLESDNDLLSNRKIGTILMKQWYRYWDTSATFLLQKTPLLDVHFIEKTKLIPTLHVIVVRHPMTSNSWG